MAPAHPRIRGPNTARRQVFGPCTPPRPEAHPGVGSGWRRHDREHASPEGRGPLRPPESCRLCQLSTTGPQDCPLMYLAMSDDELRASLHDFLQHRRLAGLTAEVTTLSLCRRALRVPPRRSGGPGSPRLPGIAATPGAHRVTGSAAGRATCVLAVVRLRWVRSCEDHCHEQPESEQLPVAVGDRDACRRPVGWR
ncbi:DUF6767 domain-containing protein [Dactylosporangium sp. NPDC051541]|uniref:DUF6767 domain-containing protein n=1 Tax=Dactylosporangium sp. NPDC051541 TaxID=3363977 RepID=UPI0037AA4527